MGEIFANQPHPTSNFVKIVIPKMRLIDERSDIERDLEMEIQSKVIPMLSELSEKNDLLDNFKQSHDLLPDIIEFLQHARTTNINIKKFGRNHFIFDESSKPNNSGEGDIAIICRMAFKYGNIQSIESGDYRKYGVSTIAI